MLMTNSIRKGECVAVCRNAGEIYVRSSGKAQYGHESPLCTIEDGTKLVINAATAKRFGLTIEIRDETREK